MKDYTFLFIDIFISFKKMFYFVKSVWLLIFY